MLDWFKRLFQSDYQYRLEKFISSHYPQNCADIERLIEEYNRKAVQSWR